MLRVGVTGGIGSGKSTVSGRMAELGAVVIDADAIAREVLAPGQPAVQLVAQRFGTDFVRDGVVDRAALGRLVFTDEYALRDLEDITHPIIVARTNELWAAAPHDAIVVHDMPLIVEQRQGANYHLVVVVDSFESTRLDRLVTLRGMSRADARDRIAAQASDTQRRACADVLVSNESTREVLIEKVNALWHDRLVPFEANVRTGTRSRRPDTLTLSDPDPSWAAQATRIGARVAKAFGEASLRVDHVGSTSVAGLMTKDVIDLQVGVRSLADVDTDDVLEATRAAGFPRATEAGLDHDHAKDGTIWPKRFHGSADPMRVCHIHVREVGSPGWEWALRFRDWLRADPAARHEYAELKRSLAAGLAPGNGTNDYADTKEPWFDSIHDRVMAWAKDTGWAPQPPSR